MTRGSWKAAWLAVLCALCACDETVEPGASSGESGAAAVGGGAGGGSAASGGGGGHSRTNHATGTRANLSRAPRAVTDDTEQVVRLGNVARN